jgi:hypothetical protein
MRFRHVCFCLSVSAVLVSTTVGCATLQQMAALRNVDFALDRVSKSPAHHHPEPGGGGVVSA